MCCAVCLGCAALRCAVNWMLGICCLHACLAKPFEIYLFKWASNSLESNHKRHYNQIHTNESNCFSAYSIFFLHSTFRNCNSSNQSKWTNNRYIEIRWISIISGNFRRIILKIQITHVTMPIRVVFSSLNDFFRKIFWLCLSLFLECSSHCIAVDDMIYGWIFATGH